jgi:hypothetical protein
LTLNRPGTAVCARPVSGARMRGSHGAASLPLQVKCTPAQGEPIPQANTSKGKTPRIEIREAIGFKLRPAGDSKPVHSQKTPAPSPATHYSRTATVPFVMSSTGPATDQSPANSPRLSAIGAADERAARLRRNALPLTPKKPRRGRWPDHWLARSRQSRSACPQFEAIANCKGAAAPGAM